MFRDIRLSTLPVHKVNLQERFINFYLFEKSLELYKATTNNNEQIDAVLEKFIRSCNIFFENKALTVNPPEQEFGPFDLEDVNSWIINHGGTIPFGFDPLAFFIQSGTYEYLIFRKKLERMPNSELCALMESMGIHATIIQMMILKSDRLINATIATPTNSQHSSAWLALKILGGVIAVLGATIIIIGFAVNPIHLPLVCSALLIAFSGCGLFKIGSDYTRSQSNSISYKK